MNDRSGAEDRRPSGFVFSGAGEDRVMNFVLNLKIIL